MTYRLVGGWGRNRVTGCALSIRYGFYAPIDSCADDPCIVSKRNQYIFDFWSFFFVGAKT